VQLQRAEKKKVAYFSISTPKQHRSSPIKPFPFHPLRLNNTLFFVPFSIRRGHNHSNNRVIFVDLSNSVTSLESNNAFSSSSSCRTAVATATATAAVVTVETVIAAIATDLAAVVTEGKSTHSDAALS
jgi:hypothetical protein